MRSTFLRLLRLALPLWRHMALAVLLGIATIASGVGLLAISAYLIALAALHPSIAELQVAIVAVRFFGITRGVFRYLERLVSHNVAFRLLARLRVWFYQRLEPLAPARLMEYRSGDLLSRIVADIEALQQFFVRVIAPPLCAIGIALLVWLLAGSFDLSLAVVMIVALVLSGVLVPALVHRLSRGMGHRMVETRASLNATLVEGIQGCADLLACGHETDHRDRVQSLSSQLVRTQSSVAQVKGLSGALTGLSMNLATIAVLMAAIPLVTAARVNGIYLALLVMVAIASFEAVTPLPSAFQDLETSLSAAKRLFEVVDTQPEVEEPAGPSPEADDFAITVRDLRFCYSPGAPPALDGISFHLGQGRRLALVGPSGAGKSTMVHLLMRFWDYDQGEIILGGHALRSYRSDDLRRMISVVSQHTDLFNDTVRANLLLAHPNASEQDLVRAAELAQIHEFITGLPDGYDTRIGEAGLRLSGGERQRLAVARALLKDAPILILDEPTANLDVLTERSLLQTLLKLMESRTTLIITHRLIALEAVEEILVLREGRVVERGPHHELVRAGGLYQRMWSMQSETDVVETLPRLGLEPT
jgi:ATP-binding cassette subfamily C protein CydC